MDFGRYFHRPNVGKGRKQNYTKAYGRILQIEALESRHLLSAGLTASQLDYFTRQLAAITQQAQLLSAQIQIFSISQQAQSLAVDIQKFMATKSTNVSGGNTPLSSPSPTPQLTTPSTSITTAATPVIKAQATLTLYVHEGSANGPVLSGVRVTGQDAAGRGFEQASGGNGTVVLTGKPGDWQFTIAKNGYEPVHWTQAITQTTTRHAFFAYVQPIAKSEPAVTPAALLAPSLIGPGMQEGPPGTIQTDTSVTFQWYPVAGASGYKFYLRDLNTNELIEQRDLSAVTTTFSRTLIEGHQYRWNMRAINGTVVSDISQTLYFQVRVTVAAPVAPSLIGPGMREGPGTIQTDTTVTFQWYPVEGASGYRFYLRDLNTKELIEQRDLPAGTTTFSRSLLDGHQYRWNMRALNGTTMSDISQTLCFQVNVPVAAPAASSPVLSPSPVTPTGRVSTDPNAILNELQSTGAGATANDDKLPQRGITGVHASETMAETDRALVMRFKDAFVEAGNKYNLPPALLAAIASRETRGTDTYLVDGWGDNGYGFGLMQVDRRHHRVVTEGGPFGQPHINQAASILRHDFDSVGKQFPDLTKAQQLCIAIARYNGGPDQSPPNFDVGTTHGDYANDVWARARFYARMKDWSMSTPVAQQKLPYLPRWYEVSPLNTNNTGVTAPVSSPSLVPTAPTSAPAPKSISALAPKAMETSPVAPTTVPSEAPASTTTQMSKPALKFSPTPATTPAVTSLVLGEVLNRFYDLAESTHGFEISIVEAAQTRPLDGAVGKVNAVLGKVVDRVHNLVEPTLGFGISLFKAAQKLPLDSPVGKMNNIVGYIGAATDAADAIHTANDYAQGRVQLARVLGASSNFVVGGIGLIVPPIGWGKSAFGFGWSVIGIPVGNWVSKLKPAQEVSDKVYELWPTGSDFLIDFGGM